MKRKALKTLALGTALLVAGSSFTACKKSGGGSDVDISNGSEVVLNGDAIYPVKCDDKLTYWMGQSIVWTHKYENFGDTPLGKKIAENTGVNVEYVHPTAGQDTEQFQLLLASDELPDLIQYGWNNYPGGPDVAINEGYILKLNEVFEKYAPALSKLLKENETYEKQVKSDSGSYYAFPFMMEEGILQLGYGPVVRADWMKKYNLSTPTTIDEWEKVLQTFKDNGVEAPYTGPLSNLQYTFMPGFNLYPGYYQNDGKVVYGQAEPAYKDFLTKMNDWYKKGLIDKDMAVIDSKAIDNKVLNGRTGAIQAWNGSGVGQYLKAAGGKDGFDLMGVQYPSTKSGEKADYSYVSNPVRMDCGTAINTKCPNIELAARFLDYGFTEEGHNLFNFGIEGESYNWVDKDGEKYPQYTDLILNNPDGLTIANAMGLYMRSCYNGIMVQDTRYMEQYYTTKQQQDTMIEWAKTNMRNHLLPQLYVLDSEADRDSEIKTNVDTYVEEQTIKFITGERSLDEFDAYIQQLKDFGIEDALKFRQEAYKRYEKR